MDKKVLLKVRKLQKTYRDFFNLNIKEFTIHAGEIHGLVGVNGAGKSCFLNILSGLETPNAGNITIEGIPQAFFTPFDAQSKGIICIHQSINLIDDLTVAENLYLGNLPKSLLGKINWKHIYNISQRLLDQFGFPICSQKKVSELNLASRRMVEIARAFEKKPKILLLDEPLASIPNNDAEVFFQALNKLCKQGIGIVYVSHNLENVLSLSDTITIMSKGSIVSEFKKSPDVDVNKIVKQMAGVKYKHNYPKIKTSIGRILLEADTINTDRNLNNVSFHVRKGEILGIAGLMNSGRTALARAIFGLDRIKSGNIRINDAALKLRSPEDAINAGIGYLEENKIGYSLIDNLSIPPNITITRLSDVTKPIGLNLRKEENYARHYIKNLVIRTQFLHSQVTTLSAGNQQKVRLAKWLFAGCKVLILEEPTQQLDLASRNDIYNYMISFVQCGSAIILISSDVNELMGLSDRIITLYRGQISKEFHRGEFSAEKIMSYAFRNEMIDLD